MAGYAKLFSTIIDSSIWSASKDAKILFVTMLAKADATGFVEAAVPGLARAADLTIEETIAALQILNSPDKYSKSPAEDGRRVIEVDGGWMLVNYESYRSRQDDQKRREYMRDYMRKRRSTSVNNGKQQLTSVTQAEADIKGASPDATASPSLSVESEDFSLCSSEKENTSKPFSSVNKAELIFDYFKNSRAIKKPSRLTATRRKKLACRLADCDWIAVAKNAIDKLPIENRPGFDWQPDFDWLIANDTNADSLAEGKYDRGEYDPRGNLAVLRQIEKGNDDHELRI